MNPLSQQNIFIVDDDESILKVVGRTLKQAGAEVTCFTRAAACLEQLRSKQCDLLITDLRMPGMSGMELLREAKRIMPSLPVVVITAYGDVPVAVEAMKAGAADFLEKPLERQSFLSAVGFAIRQSMRSHPTVLRLFTQTELQVLRLILQGKSTKDIAALRNRSIRTIEDERRRIMAKVGANNMVELIRYVAVVRFPDLLEAE